MNKRKEYSKMNTFTDDDWLTPPELITSLGSFDLDPCSPKLRPWDTAARHFTIEDDGLAQEWTGRIWLNPPYSKLEGKPQVDLWLSKLMKHDAGGIALTNAKTETDWFFKCVWRAAQAIVFPKTRIKFYRPDGTFGENNGGKSPNVIIAYTEADAQILYHAKLSTGFRPLREGQFIPLVIKIAANFKTTWRKLIRWLLKESGGTATLEQIYALASDHPKALQNPNWKAKLRQQVQREAKRVGPSLWQLQPELL